MGSTGAGWLLGLSLVAGAGAVQLCAQEPHPEPAADAISVDRVRAALAADQSNLHSLFVVPPDQFHWGVCQLVQPASPSQFIAVRVPIGDLATRVAHRVAVARRHHAEDAARAEVIRALAAFEGEHVIRD